jgi:hypothetical protein
MRLFTRFYGTITSIIYVHEDEILNTEFILFELFLGEDKIFPVLAWLRHCGAVNALFWCGEKNVGA